MTRIALTPSLLNGEKLLRGEGFLSNSHWAVRTRRFRRATGACLAPPIDLIPNRAARRWSFLLTKGRRFRVARTGRAGNSFGIRVVEYAGRALRNVWVQEIYAEQLLGDRAWALIDRDKGTTEVTDDADPARSTVLVLGLRPGWPVQRDRRAA